MKFPTRSAASRRRHNQSIDNSALNGPLHALELAIREADLRKSEGYRRGILPEYPTFIEHGPIRLLVSASPTDRNLSSYIHTLSTHNVTHVVRVCEPYYDSSVLTEQGFVHHDWPFDDGDAPPDRVIQNWLDLLDSIFNLRKYTSDKLLKASAFSLDDEETSAYVSDITTSPASSTDSAPNSPIAKETIAVHCAAGLGRAPVLAALALVEVGLDPVEAVGWLRALRRGAINGAQLAFLNQYQQRPPLQPQTKTSPKSRSKLGFFAAFRHSKNVRSRSASDEKLPPVSSKNYLLRSSPASSSSQKNLSLSRLQLPEATYYFDAYCRDSSIPIVYLFINNIHNLMQPSATTAMDATATPLPQHLRLAISPYQSQQLLSLQTYCNSYSQSHSQSCLRHAFASLHDAVLDAVISAIGASSSASFSHIFAYALVRRAAFFTTSGTVDTLTDVADWRIHIRRVLYTSPHIRICRSPEASVHACENASSTIPGLWQVSVIDKRFHVPTFLYCDKSCAVHNETKHAHQHDTNNLNFLADNPDLNTNSQRKCTSRNSNEGGAHDPDRQLQASSAQRHERADGGMHADAAVRSDGNDDVRSGRDKRGYVDDDAGLDMSHDTLSSTEEGDDTLQLSPLDLTFLTDL